MIRARKKCEICFKEVSLSNYNKHMNSCGNQKQPLFSISSELFYNDKWHCPDCDFIGNSSQSIISHYFRKHTKKGNNHHPLGDNHKAWNRGLTKEDHKSIAQYAETQRRLCSEGKITPYLKYYQNLQPSDKKEEKLQWKRRRQIQATDQQGNTIYLDSNYERIVLNELNKNNVRWFRPSKSFPYIDAEKINRSYTPDFYLPDYDVYLDPKNDLLISRSGDLFERVREQNNIRLIILRKTELSWAIIRSKI